MRKAFLILTALITLQAANPSLAQNDTVTEPVAETSQNSTEAQETSSPESTSESPDLTEEQLSSFLVVLEEVRRELPESLEQLSSEEGPSQVPAEIQLQLESIAKEHGFASSDEWFAIGQRVIRAFTAIQMLEQTTSNDVRIIQAKKEQVESLMFGGEPQ